MTCHKKAYQTTVEYVSDGRVAMWHLPFPFLHPSDISVIVTDSMRIEHRWHTPDQFIAYWDYIVAVVPVGWTIRISLIPPLETVLAGLAKLPKHKKLLDTHKVQAISTQAYLSECEDGSYDVLAEDVEGLDDDVPFPELQNDRRVLIEGDPNVTHVTPCHDNECVKPNCHALEYESIGCACVKKCGNNNLKSIHLIDNELPRVWR